MGKTILLILFLMPVFIGFYKVNELNYSKHSYIQNHIVNHPEKLPNPESAKISSFGFQNVWADMYWLETLQYIGGNVISGEYKKYLFAMMDLITELDPSFESPYVVGQLLLPSGENEDKNLTKEEKDITIEQGVTLGIKGVKNFCDTQKINAILLENDLQKISTEEKYSNPCKSYKIPYYLAFIYYFYLHDGLKAASYYKVVAAQEDAPSGAKVLAAIMQGKGGDREKSLFMFLSLAKSLANSDEACSVMTEKVQEAYSYIAKNKIPLTGEMLAAIQTDRNMLFPKLTEKNEDELLGDTQCSNYLAKATRELNLMYLDQADSRYIIDHTGSVSAMTPEILLKEKYINFIPTDFQQYSDTNQGIIYKYNDEIRRFDYEMYSYPQ